MAYQRYASFAGIALYVERESQGVDCIDLMPVAGQHKKIYSEKARERDE